MPREVHSAILKRTRELVTEQALVFQEDVRPALAKEGIEILRWDELTSAEKDRMDELFAERIFPCSPRLLSIPRIRFPTFLACRSIAVLVRNPETRHSPVRPGQGADHAFRFIPLAEGRYTSRWRT